MNVPSRRGRGRCAWRSVLVHDVQGSGDRRTFVEMLARPSALNYVSVRRGREGFGLGVGRLVHAHQAVPGGFQSRAKGVALEPLPARHTRTMLQDSA